MVTANTTKGEQVKPVFARCFVHTYTFTLSKSLFLQADWRRYWGSSGYIFNFFYVLGRCCSLRPLSSSSNFPLASGRNLAAKQPIGEHAAFAFDWDLAAQLEPVTLL